MTRRLHWAALGAAVLAVAAGCQPQPEAPYRLTCYLSSWEDLERVGRVVLVELDQSGEYPEAGRHMTEALYRSLREMGLFHIEVLRRDDVLARDLGLDRPRRYSTAELSAMAQTLGADAVLFGRVSGFKPHPRMQMGLYLSLVDLRAGHMVWGVDHFWDTTERSMEIRLKRYYRHQMRSGYTPADWEMALMSPRAFEKFVAYEASRTLQPPAPPDLDEPLRLSGY